MTPVKEEAVASEEQEQEQEVKNDVREETVGDEGNREALMSDIKRALHKRASYIKANSE